MSKRSSCIINVVGHMVICKMQVAVSEHPCCTGNVEQLCTVIALTKTQDIWIWMAQVTAKDSEWILVVV